MVGKTYECVVETRKCGLWITKTESGKTIKVKCDTLSPDQDVLVKVEKLVDGELYGLLVEAKEKGN